jgi:hypothetical protein
VIVAPSSSPSSSTKKAAKLAKSGSGKKVRFQGGTLFPVVVTIVVVLGLSLVLYARQSRPSVDASGSPQVSDHWHHAYGFYLCDTWVQLEGDAEQQGTDNFTQYARSGVHSHDDGLMHWHPFTSAAVGSNARLGVFLDTYNVELTNTKLTFPDSQRASLEAQLVEQDPAREDPLVWEDGDTCTIDGSEETGKLQVVVWNNFTDTDDGTTYIADFDNIRLDRDQMVVVMAFVPDGTDVTMPPWAPRLPELGQIDSGVLDPSTELPPGDTIPVDDTTVPVEGTPSDASVPATTEG